MADQSIDQSKTDFAVKQLLEGNHTIEETVQQLVDAGMTPAEAENTVEQLARQILEAQRSSARRDILWGLIWCVGGLVATLADFGFIFWGAILFGGIQLIKGLIALSATRSKAF